MRLVKYLMGLWTGASLLAGVAAYVLVYGTTGKLVIPRKTGAELLTSQEAADQLAAWVSNWEQEHEESI